MFSKSKYLKRGRLANVIALISALGSVEGNGFLSEESLTQTFNGKPSNDDNTWFEVAEDHPEFFRKNMKGNDIILLLRNANRTIDGDKENYPKLEIGLTQKLIDQAILLHDKELARYQRNSFLIPILTVFLTALLTWVIASSTNTSANSSLKTIEAKLDQVLAIDSLNQRR